MSQTEVQVIRDDLRMAIGEIRGLRAEISDVRAEVSALKAAERFQVDQRHGILILLAAGIGSVVTWVLAHLSFAK
jgi:hypothetical protein